LKNVGKLTVLVPIDLHSIFFFQTMEVKVEPKLSGYYHSSKYIYFFHSTEERNA